MRDGTRRLDRGWNGTVRHELETRLRPALDDHGFNKHSQRPHPKPSFAIERAVDDDFFFRFRMPCHPHDFVVVSLVVSIAA